MPFGPNEFSFLESASIGHNEVMERQFVEKNN